MKPIDNLKKKLAAVAVVAVAPAVGGVTAIAVPVVGAFEVRSHFAVPAWAVLVARRPGEFLAGARLPRWARWRRRRRGRRRCERELDEDERDHLVCMAKPDTAQRALWQIGSAGAPDRAAQ